MCVVVNLRMKLEARGIDFEEWWRNDPDTAAEVDELYRQGWSLTDIFTHLYQNDAYIPRWRGQ